MRKELKHIFIAVLLGCLCFMLPRGYGLTAAGIRLLAVFLPTVYLWITCGLGWPSLLSVTMAILLRTADGSRVYSAFWGNSCVALVVPFFMLAGTLEESGAMEWLVKWILSRQMISGRPTLFRILYCFAIVLVTSFCGAQVSCLIMFRILREIADSIGCDDRSEFYRSHGLLTVWVTQSMDGVRPWGRPHTMTLVGLLIGLGFSDITVFTTLCVGIPFGASVIVTACLLVRLWMKPDMEPFTSYRPEMISCELKKKPLTLSGKSTLIALAAIMLFWILAEMKFLGPVSVYFSSISLAAPVCLAAVVLCVLRIDGKPIMDLRKALAKVPWSVILFLGATMFYAEYFGREEYGIAAFMKNILHPLLVRISPWGVIVIGMCFASLMTNFCSNTVTGIVVISAVVPILQTMPDVPDNLILAFGLACISITTAAFCTVSACPAMGICYGEGGVDYHGTVKYSAVFCAIQCVVMCALIIPFAAMVLS